MGLSCTEGSGCRLFCLLLGAAFGGLGIGKRRLIGLWTSQQFIRDNYYYSAYKGSIIEDRKMSHLPSAYSQLFCNIPHFFHIFLSQINCPALKVFLKPVNIRSLWDYANFPMQACLQCYLSWSFIVFCTQIKDNFILQYIQLLTKAISSAKWSMSKNINPIFLSTVNYALLLQKGMYLNLKYQRLNLAKSEQLIQQLAIKIRYPQISTVPLLHTFLKQGPTFLQAPMQKLVPLVIHINKGPMQVINVNIVKLHQLQCFLELKQRIRTHMIKTLGGNKKILSLASLFLYYSFYCFSQWDFVVVISGCIDVFAIAQFQALAEKGCQCLFVLDFVSAQADQMEWLLGWECFHWGAFFLFLGLLFCHCVY